MKKRCTLLVLIGLLISSVVTVGAATYVSCGSEVNTRYSTIFAQDKYGEQMSSATWRHTGYTVVAVKDRASGQETSKTCSDAREKVDVWNEYASGSRYHDHTGTDHSGE